jgi:hypothetical protein
MYDQNRRTPLVEDLARWHAAVTPGNGFRQTAGLDGAVTRAYEGGLEGLATGP